MKHPSTAHESVVHLGDDGAMTSATNEPAFWSEADRRELTSGSLLSVFSYSDTWDYQERHDAGDELALVLDGDIDLLVDTGRGEQPVRVGRGEVSVIPRGAWHRIAVDGPATILFVTPRPASTRHRTLSDGRRREPAGGA